MSFESAFLTMMPSTVQIAAVSSRNDYGEPTYGSNTAYRARIVDKPSFVRVSDTESIEVRTVVWLNSTAVILPTARITFPDGTTPQIVAVERYPDEDGSHHTKIMCGH